MRARRSRTGRLLGACIHSVCVLLAAGSGANCRACEEAPPPPTISSFHLLPEPSFTRVDLATDDATAALASAESDAARLAERAPESDAEASRAVASAMLAAKFLGSANALRGLARFARELPPNATAERILLSSVALAATGAYGKAREALLASHVDRSGRTTLEIEIALGLGEIDAARDAATRNVEAPSGRTTENLVLLGRVLAAMGDTAAADRAFVDAESAFAGSSPLILADIYFSRASMWERAGNLVEATSLYRAAVRRVPAYAEAAAHLASLLALNDAVALLEPLTNTHPSPEISAGLAVYRELLRDGAGKSDRDAAARTYVELLGLDGGDVIAPIVAGHAGWFFLRVANDAPHAIQAASIDVREHPSSDAYELALAAYGDTVERRDDRCRIAARARAFPYPSVNLQQALQRVVDCPR
ncbi:MAG: hypothetical protein U0414_04080 [Polyangiaceae bacterium]